MSVKGQRICSRVPVGCCRSCPSLSSLAFLISARIGSCLITVSDYSRWFHVMFCTSKRVCSLGTWSRFLYALFLLFNIDLFENAKQTACISRGIIGLNHRSVQVKWRNKSMHRKAVYSLIIWLCFCRFTWIISIWELGATIAGLQVYTRSTWFLQKHIDSQSASALLLKTVLL